MCKEIRAWRKERQRVSQKKRNTSRKDLVRNVLTVSIDLNGH